MPAARRPFWSRFVTIAKPYFVSEARWQGIGLFALLVTFLLATSGLNVVNSFVGRDFMTAISQREPGRFVSLALCYAVVFVLSTAVGAFYRFTEETLGLRWREWLTRHLTDRYLAKHAYYRIKSAASVDNPDQRIAEDTKTFTVNTLSITLILLNSTITLCAFAGVLWSITPWLFLAAVGYALFGSLTTILLGRRLVALDVLQLKKEADLRYELIRVREYAEPIALLRGEGKENQRVRRRLRALVENFRAMIRLNRNLAFFTEGYKYMIQLIPLVIAAPLYMHGRIEFGMVTQAAMAFSLVINAFSVIVTEFQRIIQFAADLERLTSLWEATEDRPVPGKGPLELVEDGDLLAYEGVTLVTPAEGRLLIDNLSLKVPPGRRLLITGPDGSGRSSLLRATAGLWTAGQGRIIRPPPGQVMFLPQQPYLVRGSLRDQLVYACRDEALSADRIREVVHQVHLGPVLERVGGLDVERDWPNVLSLGEQQLVGFSRVLLAEPQFAFLDEATNALDPQRADQLYRALAATSTTYVSVGNDRGLLDYHDMVLEVEGNGVWRVASCVPEACVA
jgi:putative ATP-binding cassette transporter